ncbi:MAG: hypothetical protein C0506_13705 [Anaerolinea sp.]|nr:hypothetical protein [Anaerolinea sp.]
MRGLKGEAAAVGIAEFAPERKPPREWMGLEVYSELARQALADAGLSIRDVDRIITGNSLQEAQMFHPGHADRVHGHRVPLLRGAGSGRRGWRGRCSAGGSGHRSGALQASGRGTLYGYTVARREQSPEFAADTPYIIAAITLEERPRMTSLLVEADPDSVAIDGQVEVTWDDVSDELSMPYFRPARG